MTVEGQVATSGDMSFSDADHVAAPHEFVAARRSAGAKRAFDLVLALLLLVALGPLLIAIAVAVRATSRGPIIFRQRRVGRAGVEFEILKFRTMVDGAEDMLIDLTSPGGRPLFKMESDPRATPLGRFLRATSVDELPQLWNVVRGEMSLVGPRPALPSELVHWPDELHHRLDVDQGITGPWQVSGRSNVGFDDYRRLDLEYVENNSFTGDLRILAQTIPAVARRRGAR